MGPSGTGKTFIAAGLVYEVVSQDYKAYMVTMEDVINTIKMKTLMPSAMTAYNRLIGFCIIVKSLNSLDKVTEWEIENPSLTMIKNNPIKIGLFNNI